MILTFIKEFQLGEKTHFIEKIWAGFALNDFLCYQRNGCWSTEIFKEKYPYADDIGDPNHWWFPFMKSKPKITTIRADEKNRWHEGKLIHFMQWIGEPYRSSCYHFAPVIPCVSVQKIEIIHGQHDSIRVIIDDALFYYQIKPCDNASQENETMLQLATNDGFESIADFFKYFNKDFTGKIIHWTDLRY